MAPQLAQLHAMTDAEIRDAYDGMAGHTVVGTAFYLDELNRRALDRGSAAALEEARRARLLAIANMILALVAVIIAVVVPIATAPDDVRVRACDAIPIGGGEPKPALCVESSAP